MEDLELFKAIQRAVVGTPMDHQSIRKAVQRVRDLVANPPAAPAPEPRKESRAKDRLERDAKDRSE